MAGSAQHLGAPVIEPLADLLRVEADELADLEEGDPSLGDQAAYEALPDVEYRRNPWDVIQLATRSVDGIEPTLDHQSLPTVRRACGFMLVLTCERDSEVRDGHEVSAASAICHRWPSPAHPRPSALAMAWAA